MMLPAPTSHRAHKRMMTGVYEVYVTSTSGSSVYMANGLITHGTWGGLFLSSDASS